MCGSVALTAQNLTIAEYSLYNRQTHSKRLLGQIDTIIQESAVGWDEISAIALTLGPGSFTGLRIALSTVKGLAFALNKRLIGVNSLTALASQVYGYTGHICPIMDARKREVYCAIYQRDIDGLPKEVMAPTVISPDILMEHISTKTLFLGDGVAVYGERIGDRLGEQALFAPALTHFSRAAAVGLLAQKAYQNGDFLDPAAAAPIYIRPSDAEINFAHQT